VQTLSKGTKPNPGNMLPSASSVSRGTDTLPAYDCRVCGERKVLPTGS